MTRQEYDMIISMLTEIKGMLEKPPPKPSLVERFRITVKKIKKDIKNRRDIRRGLLCAVHLHPFDFLETGEKYCGRCSYLYSMKDLPSTIITERDYIYAYQSTKDSHA